LPNAVPVMLFDDKKTEKEKIRRRVELCPEEWENDFGDEFYEHTIENGFYYIAPNTEWNSQANSILAPGMEQFIHTSQEEMQIKITDLKRGANTEDGQ